MGLFNKHKDTKKIKELSDLYAFLKHIHELTNEDKYISRRDFLTQQEKAKPSFDHLKVLENDDVLDAWSKNKKINPRAVRKVMHDYITFEKEINDHNQLYIKYHLDTDKEYLDNIYKAIDPKVRLDDEQRKVVLSDEDYTLVIAGAGAGKSTTIEAKAKYLVEKRGVDPKRILVISFTKEATQKLRDDFEKLNIPVKTATFHSIGYELIKQGDAEKHKIVEQSFRYAVIRDYLCGKIEDRSFVKKLLLFFASYLAMPLDSDNQELLFRRLSANDITTLKCDLSKLKEAYKESKRVAKETMNDEKTRSYQECRIANFLFIHGIDYEYEPLYPYCFDGTNKPYTPDFLIKCKDDKGNPRNVYLEHFGLSEDLKNNSWTEKEVEKYKKEITDKIKMHKAHKTELIYTYSKYLDNRDFIAHLEEILIKNGIKFNEPDEMALYKRIAVSAEDKYLNRFIMLVCSFINRFKVNNFEDSQFNLWRRSIKDDRTKLFLDIARCCINQYKNKLSDENAIDFEDMINDASNLLDITIKEKKKLPYDYIIVDEYQDVSMQRFQLCKKLSDASDAKIIAVGDDWQSIFKFAGSQIDLFTEFKKNMGYAQELKITRTYRNSQELIDIAGEFVMANKKQFKKQLISGAPSIEDPVILMSYDDSYRKDSDNRGPFYRLGDAIEKSLDHIVSQSPDVNKERVLIIGRYNFDGKNLSRLTDLFEWYENNNDSRIVSKKHKNLKITFLTAHASKGATYTNVIIVNGKDDVLGFPSKIEDDPVMKLVVKEQSEIEYAEERRLFYVALTRTKNRVYLITPQYRPSQFILELQKKFTNVVLRGVKLTPKENPAGKKSNCPCCGYPLQLRKTNIKSSHTLQKLWICSNDPEACGFMTNDLSGGKASISKCPNCVDGYLIVKPIGDKNNPNGRKMLGCTNYKPDETGCNCKMMINDFTQDKTIMFLGKNGRLHNVKHKPDILLVYNAVKTIYKEVPAFKFNAKSLADYLLGNESRPITAFNLKEHGGAFGALTGKKAYKTFKIINELVSHDIFKVEKDKFSSLTIIAETISNEAILQINNAISNKK